MKKITLAAKLAQSGTRWSSSIAAGCLGTHVLLIELSAQANTGSSGAPAATKDNI